MKCIHILLAFLFVMGIRTVSGAGGQDTLILLDGKIVTGQVEDKTMEVLNNPQGNINSWYTLSIGKMETYKIPKQRD